MIFGGIEKLKVSSPDLVEEIQRQTVGMGGGLAAAAAAAAASSSASTSSSGPAVASAVRFPRLPDFLFKSRLMVSV